MIQKAELPSTIYSIREYLETDPPIQKAVVCFLMRENQVLLGVRKKTELGLGLHVIAGIGGKVGDHPEFAGETEEDAVVRELREEIGITPTSFQHAGQVLFLYPDKPTWNLDVGIYLVHKWEDEPIETEVIQPHWHHVSNLPFRQMFPDATHWIPHVLAKRSLQAAFLYRNDDMTIQDQLVDLQ